MNTKPLAYVLTFILGASLTRLAGYFLLGYDGSGFYQPVYAENIVALAGAAAVCSSILLAYIAFMRVPSIHWHIRKALSYVFTATGSVAAWRIYAFSRGSRLPFGTVANNIAMVSAMLFVSIIVLGLLAIYRDNDT